MATEKKKVQVRDLKPSKDAKGGVAKNQNSNSSSGNLNRGGGSNLNKGGGSNLNKGGGQLLS